jgi:hypothetical protein
MVRRMTLSLKHVVYVSVINTRRWLCWRYKRSSWTVSYYAVRENGTHRVKIGSPSMSIRAPKATDVAALYREKLELLGIQIAACMYSHTANGTFRNNAKTDMDALRERILCKFVLKSPRKLSPKQRIGARRTEAWTHTGCSRENTVE